MLTFPPYLLTDVSETPPEYLWLAEQPGEPIVLEYPVEWGVRFFVFYQLYHMKPIMNGGYSAKFAELQQDILDPTDPETLSILAGFGVKYIITHDSYFLEQFPDYIPDKKFALSWMTAAESWRYSAELDEVYESVAGVKLVKEFPHAKVFEITAEPKAYVFGTGVAG